MVECVFQVGKWSHTN